MSATSSIHFFTKTLDPQATKPKSKPIDERISTVALTALDEQDCLFGSIEVSFKTLFTKKKELSPLAQPKTAIFDIPPFSRLNPKEKIFLKKALSQPFSSQAPLIYSLNLLIMNKWRTLTPLLEKHLPSEPAYKKEYKAWVAASKSRLDHFYKDSQSLIFYFFTIQAKQEFQSQAKESSALFWKEAPYESLLMCFADVAAFTRSLDLYFSPFFENLSLVGQPDARYEIDQLLVGFELYKKILQEKSPESLLFLVELSSFKECAQSSPALSQFEDLFHYLTVVKEGHLHLYPELLELKELFFDSSDKLSEKPMKTSRDDLQKGYVKSVLKCEEKKNTAFHNVIALFQQWHKKKNNLKELQLGFSFWIYTLQGSYILGKIGKILEESYDLGLNPNVKELLFLSRVDSKKHYRSIQAKLKMIETPPALRGFRDLALQVLQVRELGIFTEDSLCKDPVSHLFTFLKSYPPLLSKRSSGLDLLEDRLFKKKGVLKTLEFNDLTENLFSAHLWFEEMSKLIPQISENFKKHNESLELELSHFNFIHYPKKDCKQFLENLFFNALWPSMLYIRILAKMQDLLFKKDSIADQFLSEDFVDLFTIRKLKIGEEDTHTIPSQPSDTDSETEDEVDEEENLTQALSQLSLEKQTPEETQEIKALFDKSLFLRAKKLREIQKILTEQGFRFARTKGSHEIWTPRGGQGIVVVPHHTQKDIPTGTRSSIARQVMLAKSSFS